MPDRASHPARGLVCIITDRRRLCPEGSADQQRRALVEQALAAAQAGADIVQVRERDLPDRELFKTVHAIVQAAEGTPLRVLVNDRVDVAIAAGAAGAQLRGDGMPVEDVRRLLAPLEMLIGRSVHAPPEAGLAADAGADLVLFGTVFPTSSKAPGHPVAGVAGLAAAVRACAVPVLAVGGVTAANVRAVAGAGAAGVAAIGWFAVRDAGRMRSAVEEARRAFD